MVMDYAAYLATLTRWYVQIAVKLEPIVRTTARACVEKPRTQNTHGATTVQAMNDYGIGIEIGITDMTAFLITIYLFCLICLLHHHRWVFLIHL